MKRFLFLLALWPSLVAAQVNQVPQIGVTSAFVKVPTYSAVSIGLVPASSATDIFCISGSTTKAISIKQINISGVAGTLTSVPFTLLHRVSLDTGGTAALTTAAPNLTVGPMSSTDPVATATLIAYTANPTIVDTSPTYARTTYLTAPTVAAGTVISPIQWNFGEQIATFSKAADIPRNVTGQWCVNLNATTVSSGLLDIDITWTEQ